VVDRRCRDQAACLPLMVMDAAVKQDQGRDVRMEASMIKVFATEMATEVIDHAQQAFGHGRHA